MSTVYKAVYEDDKPIVHWRTKGSKNGVRQWQNEDGSYTEAGRNSKPGGRYNTDYDPEKARKKAEKAAYKTEKRAIGNGRYAAAKRRQQGFRQAIITPGDMGKCITDVATGKMSLDDYYKKIGAKWMGQVLVVGALSCGAIIGTELLLNQGYGAEVAEQLANKLMKGELKPDNYAGVVRFDKFSDLFKYAKMKDPDAYVKMKETQLANANGFVSTEAMDDLWGFAADEAEKEANEAAYKLYKDLWNDPDADPYMCQVNDVDKSGKNSINVEVDENGNINIEDLFKAAKSAGPKDYDSWLRDREEHKVILGPNGMPVNREQGGVETLQDQIDDMNKRIELQDILFGFGASANSK